MICLSIFRLTNNSCCRKSYGTVMKGNQPPDIKFEPVFSFSFVKYIASLHRVKVYHILGSCVAVPTCGILELCNVLSESSFLATTYIGEFNSICCK